MRVKLLSSGNSCSKNVKDGNGCRKMSDGRGPLTVPQMQIALKPYAALGRFTFQYTRAAPMKAASTR